MEHVLACMGALHTRTTRPAIGLLPVDGFAPHWKSKREYISAAILQSLQASCAPAGESKRCVEFAYAL